MYANFDQQIGDSIYNKAEFRTFRQTIGEDEPCQRENFINI